MLRCQANEDLINLDNLDDSVDNFLSNKSNILAVEIGPEAGDKIQPDNDTILNEEIDTRNLPASPPFTKVSTIKMFSGPSKKPATPLRPKKQQQQQQEQRDDKDESSKENRTVTLARKDHTKSFLPRIKKRQKQ